MEKNLMKNEIELKEKLLDKIIKLDNILFIFEAIMFIISVVSISTYIVVKYNDIDISFNIELICALCIIIDICLYIIDFVLNIKKLSIEEEIDNDGKERNTFYDIKVNVNYKDLGDRYDYFCPTCGNKVVYDSEFCPHCNQKLSFSNVPKDKEIIQFCNYCGSINNYFLIHNDKNNYFEDRLKESIKDDYCKFCCQKNTMHIKICKR